MARRRLDGTDTYMLARVLEVTYAVPGQSDHVKISRRMPVMCMFRLRLEDARKAVTYKVQNRASRPDATAQVRFRALAEFSGLVHILR
jgi:hypothetical protein